MVGGEGGELLDEGWMEESEDGEIDGVYDLLFFLGVEVLEDGSREGRVLLDAGD